MMSHDVQRYADIRIRNIKGAAKLSNWGWGPQGLELLGRNISWLPNSSDASTMSNPPKILAQVHERRGLERAAFVLGRHIWIGLDA